jgi:hypothetical protein
MNAKPRPVGRVLGRSSHKENSQFSDETVAVATLNLICCFSGRYFELTLAIQASTGNRGKYGLFGGKENGRYPKTRLSFPFAFGASFPQILISFNEIGSLRQGNDLVSSFVSLRFPFLRHRVRFGNEPHDCPVSA